MDYTNEILERLQKGEAIEDIAAKLTEDLNTANEQYKAAKAKTKQDNLFTQKVEAVDAILFALKDLLAVYEVNEELIDAIEETDPEEIVEVIDESLPFLTKYIELTQTFEALKDKSQKANPVSAMHAVDPIEDFLNKMVR